ncbi:P110/LppT family adhesin N-terminal domain [Mesomycoplasma ovipneumoniae]|uniref:P110/LppT family adhesin N-terminal domain n=1 Tax=Mesomycoplasma ovipneumoniae TaxID=29562 RepID=A0AAW6Q5E0_9BACT|nr:P110/LppT family adhesin N-terminal domain [Mesomycoplasma ovipneumoniae]MDF9627805.1 P110/LppT family adhesin N-terminal domain [Mesomycoplasma ovipneumoniae]MDO4157882.1 P110/LppT family adhesin N-terminal domain [Mesomycoplasma ovipneumoniae]MDO4158246.1 P110/LppT family adhesin N-terminal domain [Mesomycoplasma ovipneumoniae]MDO6821600.1 P110/LppT family adhesin N-terminal domain [Mesomycoplasma ovipneumoniae]MDO6855591.1 P110/LppT family adhesin N-terminal domain [Mesomycoplasma ovipne
MLNKINKIKNAKTIISTGFSITAILTTIVAVPIGLTIFERSYSSQIFGNVDKNEVVSLKTQATFSEEDFINALNNLKLHDEYKNLSAKTALSLAKNPSYAFNFLKAYDFSPITKHNFRVVLDIEKANPSGSEVKNVVVYAHSDPLKLTYSKQVDLKGFAQSDKADGDLVGFQIDLEKSKLELSAAKSSNLTASEVAFKLDNDFQASYKISRSKSQAFSDALFQNGLTYNLVNTLGLPTILEKGYVLSPKTVENQTAKQEKMVMIGDSDTKRVDSLMNVKNLVFKNHDDKAGTLSISFELIDPTGKIVKEFDFPILGIKKLSVDVKDVEKQILSQFSDLVQLKPLVQLALVKDNQSLAQTIYTDNNPVNLAKLLSKITQNFQENGRHNQVSTQLYQDPAQNSQPNDDKVEINRQDFSTFFDSKSDRIQVPGFDGYFVEINKIDLAKNLSQGQKDKLLKENKVSFEVDFQIKKQLNIEAPYLESEFVKSNYSKVLESSLASLGKGNDSKFVLIDLDSSKSTFEVQLDYDENQRKLLNSALKQNSQIDFSNLDKIDLEDPKIQNLNPLAKTFEFKENPNGPKLTLEYVKSLVLEVVEDAKNQKTFDQVARKLYFLDHGYQPEDVAKLEEYKKKYSAMFSQSEKKSEEKDKKEEKSEQDQTSTTPPNSNSAQPSNPDQPPASSQPSTDGSTETNSQAATNGSTGAAASTTAPAATPVAASIPVAATAFQDLPQETSTQTPEKPEIKEGLGIKLWSFLQKSNYPESENSDVSYDVVKNSNSQIDVVMSFNPKTAGETTSKPAKLIFSIQNLEDNQSYDYLVQHNPLLLFDFRKNQKTENGTVSKISSLNRTDVEIELNSKITEETEEVEGQESATSTSMPVAEAAEPSETTTTAPSTSVQNNANPEDGIILNKPVILGNGTQPALKNGVVMLAFSLKNITKNKKTYLLSSKGRKGLFVTKVDYNNKETLVIGLDQNGSNAASGETAYPVVGLISGVQGNAAGLFDIKDIEINNKQSKLEKNATAPLDLDVFSQKNINLTNQSANFDLLKEDDLLFLTISKKDTNFTFTLSSSRNPLSQKIVSNLNLEDSFRDTYNGHLDWSYLGPNLAPAPADQSNTTLKSDSTVTVRGLAIYDSVDLANQESISQELTNAFIKELTR